jgi:hypothetical protein
MGNKHCKNITEDIFEKEDYHHQLDSEPKSLPELESLTTQPLREKQRLIKTQKTAFVPD